LITRKVNNRKKRNKKKVENKICPDMEESNAMVGFVLEVYMRGAGRGIWLG